ncbi:MAG: AAA family ATPase, partial [Schlesneria sp.]
MAEKPQPSSYLGLFRAGLSTPEHRRFITVARDSMVNDIVDHLQRSMLRKSKHHLMFIGPRGSGKTHLLSLIEDQIAKHPDLASHYVVARFPEESNRTVSFADFLIGLCEILRDQLPDEPLWGQLHQQLATTEDDSIIVDTIVPAIRKQNHAHKRTIVVMLENVHEMFERQMSKRIDVGALRKFFMDDNGCLLIATAPMHFDAITSVKEPFFDFFDVQVLDLLSKEDSINLIRLNLEWDKRTDLLSDFDNMRPKLMALHDMTDGNPRLTLMLYELISHDSVLQVRQQFLQLLDRVTPFYQDRLRDIAPLERAVLETIATMRDSTQPKTPANIASLMRMKPQQTSNLLKRMTDSLYLKSVVNPDDKRSRLYAIREGFFDIWLAMNLSRKDRARLPILVECLAKFYPQLEDREKKRREYRQKWGEPNAEAAMDLMSEIGSPEERVKSKLELARLHGESGNQTLQSGYIRELREMSLDRVGQWIVRNADSESKTSYLDE